MIDEIKAINRYNNKHSDFVRYYRSGMTHLDSLYYLRNRNDTALYLESFHYERDPKFSTNADFKVAKLLVTELLSTCKYPFQCILEKDNRVFTFVCRPEDIKPVVWDLWTIRSTIV